MGKRKFAVYGIGNAIMDLQLQARDEDLVALQLEKGGMALVDPERQRALLEYFGGFPIHRASGGSAANTMIAIAQLGGAVAYGCLVGDDEYGHYYLNEMSDLGVVLHTAPVSGAATGTSIIIISTDAERTMNTHLGASSGFDGSQVSAECIRDAEWLYIEGYLFSSETGRDAVRTAVRMAKESGTKIAITFSDAFIVDFFGDALREAVAAADLVFANLTEAKRFTGAEDEASAFSGLAAACSGAVMTMSERGAKVQWQGTQVSAASFPVKAVDDTGAGDMFAGGFLYGITHGMSAQDSGRLACYLAGRVVSQLGPRLKEDVRTVVESREYLAAAGV